jgi:hypothetical protein
VSCPKCIAPKLSGPREACAQFIGFHGHCHSCGFTWVMHRGAARSRKPDAALHREQPRLTVIEGGAAEEPGGTCPWSAWLEGETI